jgi:hypothetical protein
MEVDGVWQSPLSGSLRSLRRATSGEIVTSQSQSLGGFPESAQLCGTNVPTNCREAFKLMASAGAGLWDVFVSFARYGCSRWRYFPKVVQRRLGAEIYSASRVGLKSSARQRASHLTILVIECSALCPRVLGCVQEYSKIPLFSDPQERDGLGGLVLDVRYSALLSAERGGAEGKPLGSVSEHWQPEDTGAQPEGSSLDSTLGGNCLYATNLAKGN